MQQSSLTGRVALVGLTILVVLLASANVATVMSAKAHRIAYEFIAPVFEGLGSSTRLDLFGESVTTQGDRRTQVAVDAAIREMQGALTESMRLEFLAEHRKNAAVTAGIGYMQGRLSTALQRNALLEQLWEDQAARIQRLEQKNYVRILAARPLWDVMRQRAVRIVVRSASALPFDWVPVLGQVVIGSLTIWDIVDACQTAKDIDRLRALDDEPTEGGIRLCLQW